MKNTKRVLAFLVGAAMMLPMASAEGKLASGNYEATSQGFGGAGFIVEHAGVEAHDVLNERNLYMQAGSEDLIHGIAKLKDQRLFRLVDDKERLRSDERQRDDQAQQERKVSLHYLFPLSPLRVGS